MTQEQNMALSTKAKQALKAKAHALKPIILIGNQGHSAAVKKEINRALDDHELIKIRIQSQDRDLRRALFTEICADAQAELVQIIGNIGVIYRKKQD